VDWGGCRCQALAFGGDAGLTDPACAKSPLHAAFAATAGREAEAEPPAFIHRNPRTATTG
jgi:pyrroloquinoline quinone biosynthesis protein E